MLHFKYLGALLILLTMFLVAGGTAWGVSPGPDESWPTLSPYPGQMGPVCPGCCPGPCMCVPSVGTWGFHQRQWRFWPGDQFRKDIRFPLGEGREPVQTPLGTEPKTPPKEEYGPVEQQSTPSGGGLQIQEGVPTAPVEVPPAFDFGPEGFGEGLPGLDVTPQGPAPEKPSDGNTTPGSGSGPTSSTDAIPPAPWFGRGNAVAITSGLVPRAEYSVPSALTAEALPKSLVNAFSETAADQKVDPPAPFPLAAANAPPSGPFDNAPLPPLVAEHADEQMAPFPEPTVPPASALAAETQVLPWSEPRESRKSPRTEPEPAATRVVDYKEPIENAAPLGLDGYCPVELIRHEQWIEGDPRWTVQYQGQTYQTSGPLAQRLFRANPERYVPVLSGYDPVAAANGGGQVKGQTETCVIYEGRLFMFSSQATLTQFRQNPKQFIPAEEK